ncbi:TRAP transporter small permease [Clostridiaceae bacterium 35-E11]
MEKAKKIFGNIERDICSILLGAMLLILSLQVVLRFVFNNSNSWSEELARYLFIWLVHIGIAYAAKEYAHIRIEALQGFFPKPIRKYIALIGEIILLIFSIVLVYISVQYTHKMFVTKQSSLGLKLNMGYVYMSIPIGYALLGLRTVQNIITKKYAVEKNEADEVIEQIEKDSKRGEK